ncbi:MAG: cupin domain-containing protein [Acidisphaera sp.]|nr:cupin domain-containing protein [Acidisphaera sp.]MBV9812985.1 cupin domain-containing protein [Acetobacteraceae bacterium]
MTVFRADQSPPAWCELENFEVHALRNGERVERSPGTRTERLIGTVGTTQLSQGGRSLLLKEGQFIDIDPSAGAWTMTGTTEPAGFVRLCGHWGADMAGCGIFRVRPTSEPETRGDPVSYRKNTAIDRHYHDCDEYWIILDGTGQVVVDDRHACVAPGDCLCIGMGHHHDFPLTDSEVKAVFFETTLQGRKRIGHLWEHTHGPAQPIPERV